MGFGLCYLAISGEGLATHAEHKAAAVFTHQQRLDIREEFGRDHPLAADFFHAERPRRGDEADDEPMVQP